jgi:predicted cupin superfamily sugar epimerase
MKPGRHDAPALSYARDVSNRNQVPAMSGEMTADEIIARLDLAPLDCEGGYIRRTWFRPSIDPEAGPQASCILYLITPDSFSALHRLRHDEMFHFYLGDPCQTTMITPEGHLREAVLGPDLRAGMQVQHLVPGGNWQATRLIEGGRWALLGTTMSPGFHASGFELAQADDLKHLDPSVRAAVAPLLATP